MTRLAVAATRYPGETRALLYAQSDDRPVEVRLFRGTPSTAEGAVWRGRVLGAVTGARAVLVDIGGTQPGFLPLKDYPGAAHDLQQGAYVTVAIDRQARAEKGPRLTGKIRLSSPWLVYSPFRKGCSVSRRLNADDADRLSQWAKAAMQPDEGLVVRGAAASQCDAVLSQDVEVLRQVWCDMQVVPNRVQCLRPAPDPFVEWLAEMAEPVAMVDVTGGDLMSGARAILGKDQVSVNLKDAFAQAGGDDALVAALSPEVLLPSGGSLSLEMTRAFWVADIDTNGVTGPQAAQLCNDEAIAALAQALRLRNLGGAVVVDVVPEGKGKSARSAAQRLAPILRQLLDQDDRVQVHGVSPMGHLELVRARRGLALHEVVYGDTVTASEAAIETEALDALRSVVADVASGHPRRTLTVSAPVLGWLNGPGQDSCREAEAMIGYTLRKEVQS